MTDLQCLRSEMLLIVLVTSSMFSAVTVICKLRRGNYLNNCGPLLITEYEQKVLFMTVFLFRGKMQI